MANTKSKHILEGEDRTKKAFQAATENARTATNNMAKYGLAAGAVAAGGLAAMINTQRANIDSLAKTGDALNMATEKLAGYRHAAEQTAGVSSEVFDKSIMKMNKGLAEAANGTGEARMALDMLGLSAQQLQGMTADEKFNAIAGAMGGVADHGDRALIATQLFGREGARLVSVLNLGEEGLRRYQAEAAAMGIALSRVDAAKVEAANDSIDRAQKVARGFAQQLTVAAAPAIKAVADALFESAVEAGGFGNITTKMVGAVVKGIGYLGNSLRGLQMLWVALKLGVNQFYAYAFKAINAVAERAVALANLIPGVDIKLGETLGNIGEDLQARADSFKQELADLASQPMPLEQIEEWHAGVLERAQVQADSMVALNQQKNEALIAQDTYAKKQQRDLEAKAAADKLAEDKKVFTSAFSSATKHSKALFNLNKIAQIANAALALKSTIVSSYNYGSSIGGPPLGAVFAAIGGAAQIANIAALKSQSFGGGGGGRSGGGSAPSVSSLVDRDRASTTASGGGGAGNAPLPNVTVNVDDDALVTGKAVRNLVDRVVSGLRSGEFSGLATT